MSIVIVGATPKYVVAMSDGRVTLDESSEKLEEFKKISKINKYVCIGFTGHLRFLDELLRRFNASPKNLKDIRVNQVFQLLFSLSKDIKTNNPLLGDLATVVCGVNLNNEIESIGFSTKNFVVDKQNAKESGLAIQVLCEYPNSFKIAQSNILQCGNFIEGMERTIKYISTVDKTVNDNIFTERIDL